MNYVFNYRRYSLPFRTPMRTAHGAWTRREGLFVRLRDEDGQLGFGECAPIPWFGTETADEAAEVCASLGAGGQVSDEQIHAIAQKYACLRFAFGSAKAKAKPEASSNLPVAALLPAGRAALEKIPALAEVGFRTFKWKVGAGDALDEMALLDDVLAALPSGARLRLDANGAWTRRVAERWLSRCADYPVEFVEQPVPAGMSDDEKAIAQDLLLGLAGNYPTPLALDESVASAGDVEKWMYSGWPGIFVIKPSLLGDVMHACKGIGLRLPKDRIVFSSALETGIGACAALRVAFDFLANAADDTKMRAIGFGVWPLFEDARFDGPRTAPFVFFRDLEKLEPEVLWNTLS